MSFSAPVAAWHPWFKATLFVLLAANTAVYAISGSTSEALDSIAWLVLLAAFELETGMAGRFAAGRAAVALRAVRLAAAAAILAAGLGYVRDREWLDAANTGLWIGVVALLEIEVRCPRAAMRHRSWFATAAAALYSGLGVLVLAWMWQRSWFDAYDAALWLAAFAAIELALLRREGPSMDRVGPASRAGRPVRTDTGV